MGALIDFFGFGPKSRAYIRIRGQVLEGGYHFFIERRIRSRALNGWLRIYQLPIDSYLELEVEGTLYRIKKLLEDARNGPPSAKIFDAEVQWKTYKGDLRDFRMKT
jgi:acylphosphatase